MRKTILAASIAVLALLAPASTALAVDLPSSRHPDGSPPGGQARMKALQARAHFVPLGVKLTGTAVLDGYVYDYSSAALPAAAVDWWAAVGESLEYGQTTTDATGYYAFSGLPAAGGTGGLSVTSPTQPWTIEVYDASWPDPGTTTFNFQPGKIWTGIIRGGPWDDWSSVAAYIYGTSEPVKVAGRTVISGTNTGVWDYMFAPPGAYQLGAVYFWMNEGAQFSTTATVAAGSVSPQAVSVGQEEAQRIFATSPYWGSGKPGTVVKLRHWNIPAGWILDYYGYADSPAGTPFKEYSDLTTTGASPFTRSLTIPSSAPPGYWYILAFYNTSGVLELAEPFQVCTLKSTKTSIRKGGSIKLSGVIPTEGHWGSQAGKSKYVTIWKRTTSVSSAPTTWYPGTKGWTKVARVKASGLGKYASAYLKPTRTTWYVVQYPGDNWYWGAYTSVLKVRVY